MPLIRRRKADCNHLVHVSAQPLNHGAKIASSRIVASDVPLRAISGHVNCGYGDCMLKFFRRKRRKVSLNNDHVQQRRQRIVPQPDMRMSKYSRIRSVTAIVDDQPDWDYALDSEKSFYAVMEAAGYFGYAENMTKEQKLLRDFLIQNIAGRKISMYAWGVYADICGDVHDDILELK